MGGKNRKKRSYKKVKVSLPRLNKKVFQNIYTNIKPEDNPNNLQMKSECKKKYIQLSISQTKNNNDSKQQKKSQIQMPDYMHSTYLQQQKDQVALKRKGLELLCNLKELKKQLATKNGSIATIKEVNNKINFIFFTFLQRQQYETSKGNQKIHLSTPISLSHLLGGASFGLLKITLFSKNSINTQIIHNLTKMRYDKNKDHISFILNTDLLKSTGKIVLDKKNKNLLMNLQTKVTLDFKNFTIKVSDSMLRYKKGIPLLETFAKNFSKKKQKGFGKNQVINNSKKKQKGFGKNQVINNKPTLKQRMKSWSQNILRKKIDQKIQPIKLKTFKTKKSK